MPKVGVIDYKTKDSTIAYPFISTIAIENTMAGNISMFKDLNIN